MGKPTIMKKYFLFAVVALAFGSVSCKKCKTCTTRVTQNVQGVSVDVSVEDQDYCGDDYDDAPQETSVVQNVGGVSQTVTITCVEK